MSDKYFNPFQGLDISVPESFHAAFDHYCRPSSDAVIDQRPFPRMIDLWFLSVCVAARLELKPVDISKHDKWKMAEGSRLSSDPWRVHALMLIAIDESNDVQIVSDPSKMMGIASGLAVAALPRVIEMLNEGGSEPIWNLSNAIDTLLSEKATA